MPDYIGLSALAYDFEVDGIYYNKLSNGQSVEVTYKDTNYGSYAGSVDIPSTVAYDGTTYSVTSIGDYAFYGCNGLTEITIPNSVTSIGGKAFSGCGSLTEVTIPSSVTLIGDGAFDHCRSLEAFYGKYASEDHRCLIIDGELNAFAPYALTSYTISNSVISIGNNAFSSCSGLTEVTIPNSIIS